MHRWRHFNKKLFDLSLFTYDDEFLLKFFVSEKALYTVHSVQSIELDAVNLSILYLCMGAFGGEWDFLQTTVLIDKMWHVC